MVFPFSLNKIRNSFLMVGLIKYVYGLMVTNNTIRGGFSIGHHGD